MQRLTEHMPDNFGYVEFQFKRGVDEQDIASKLGAIEDILFQPNGTERITLARLAELVQAEVEGRAVVLPAGKIGDYVEWDTGVSVRLFQIQGILIEPDGVRYDLGDLAPFVNHKNINRILTRAEAEAKGELE